MNACCNTDIEKTDSCCQSGIDSTAKSEGCCRTEPSRA